MSMRVAIVLSLTIALLYGTAHNANAQQTVFEETKVLYASEMAGGVILHTSGWGVNYYYAKNLTGFKKMVYEAELVGMKHEKEIKTLSDFHNIRGYFYGKMNSLTILRTSIGIQKTFIPKQSIRGVAISIDYNIGISHGIVKPVYLSVRFSNNEPSQITDEIRDVKYDPDKHYPDNILGRSPIFKGLGDLKYYPGIYGKVGLNFEYSDESDFVKAVEVGLTADAFLRPIPMMAFNKNSQVFAAIYFNFIFGKKRKYGETGKTQSETAEPPPQDIMQE